MTKDIKPIDVRKRPRRTPLDGARDILTVENKDPNYVYRWTLDTPGRIEWRKERGYEIVTEDHPVGQPTVDKGSLLGSAVTRYAGNGQRLVLMRIPKEWYDEDQESKQASVSALERSMMEAVQKGRIPGSSDPGYGNLSITRK